MRMTDPAQLLDRTVVDPEGRRIGTVAEVYLDAGADASGDTEAGWLAVATGALGTHVAPVPIGFVTAAEGDVVVRLSKAQVDAAPHHDPQMALSREEEAALLDYYGIAASDRPLAAVTGRPGETPTREDYTSEETDYGGLHEGAAQSGLAARHDEARAEQHAGTGDVTEPPIYPDDAAEAQLAREREIRRRAAERRADEQR
jgi:hypothetical protein